MATRIPNSVICLVSALSFHEITTQIPHEISIAIPKDGKPSLIDYPPVQFHKFSKDSFQTGIVEHQIDRVTVKVYSPEKTLADCFKFRNKIGNIISQIRDILAVEVEPDGLTFDSEAIQTERITEDADYEGIRVRLRGVLGNARISMQIDIGFGDIVYPGPVKAELSCMLDSPAPSLLCYSRESAIAEKFEALIKLGDLHSRMKDFYDIWLLSRQYQFELSSLAEAVKLTLKQRGTELNQPIEAFSADFISSRQTMWTAFCKRLKQDHIPASFQDIAAAVELFLYPVIKSVSENMVWKPAGPWS